MKVVAGKRAERQGMRRIPGFSRGESSPVPGRADRGYSRTLSPSRHFPDSYRAGVGRMRATRKDDLVMAAEGRNGGAGVRQGSRVALPRGKGAPSTQETGREKPAGRRSPEGRGI